MKEQCPSSKGTHSISSLVNEGIGSGSSEHGFIENIGAEAVNQAAIKIEIETISFSRLK